VAANADEIAAFADMRQAAFVAEREAWATAAGAA
jgi:hypothetical protein